MPGMTSGLDATDPVLVAAFRSALLHQLAIIGVLLLALTVACFAARAWLPAVRQRPPEPRAAIGEPKSRRLLRVGFGLLWILDGILQAQPKMAGGLPSQVIQPVAASSPHWVEQLVNAGGTVWSYHPVQAAAAAVWIQAGLGVWLIAAPPGWWSRLGGAASAGWGLIVWVFGEAFGGIFAPGLSWLSGAPGAVVLYVAAGVLIALPLRAWTGPRAGRSLLAGIGVFWIGMAIVQAWPGRGFWQGSGGTLTSMVQTMAQADQPHAQSAMISAFASFTAAHGYAVNLFVVIVLGLLGVAFAFGGGQRRVLRFAVPVAAVFCIAVWILVQDLGVPGGLGTDPNSMLPWLLLLFAGSIAIGEDYLQPAEERAPLRWQAIRAAVIGRALGPRALGRAVSRTGIRTVAVAGAVIVVVTGAAPMALAMADRNADPVIARALAGRSIRLNQQAPGFRLRSETGRLVSPDSLRGKVVLLTFLDPVCVGCAQIAQELHAAGDLLDASGAEVQVVAIAATAIHSGRAFIDEFDRHQGLSTAPNWQFLTGSTQELERVWDQYERLAPRMMSGMSVHSDMAFVIDKTGRIRLEVWDGPAPATAAALSSFAVLLCDAARPVMG